MKRRLSGVLGVAITVLLLWWVLRDVSAAEILAEVRAASPAWLAAMIALSLFSFVLRALRWGVLLEPDHRGSTFGARFGSTCAGYAANNIFPARLGELIRAYVLTRVSPVAFGASVGSLVVERVLDGLVLAIFLVVPILLPGFPLGPGQAADNLRRVALLASIGFTVGFGVLWLIARRPAATMRLWAATGGRLAPERFADRLDALAETFVTGLGALARFGVLARAIAWSFAVWSCLAGSFWAAMLAFGVTAPGFIGAAFLQAVIAFAVAVPSTPGFVGVFEAGARIGLQPWDVPDPTIVGIATGYHVLTFVPVTVLGLLYVRRVGLRWADVRERPAEEMAR